MENRSRLHRPNLAQIDLVSVLLIVLCAEFGTLSRASAEANMSLSAASHRLSRVEATLGVKLFARHGRGVELTREGLRYVTLARRLIYAAECLAQAFSVNAGATQCGLSHSRCRVPESTSRTLALVPRAKRRDS